MVGGHRGRTLRTPPRFGQAVRITSPDVPGSPLNGPLACDDGDPAAVEIAGLCQDALAVDRALVDTTRVECEVVGDLARKGAVDFG